MITDPRFSTADARRKNSADLYVIMKEALLQHTSDEWLAFAREADIPMVRMQHFSELGEDEQVVANGYIKDVTYPSGTVYKVATSPIEMDSIGEIKTEPTKAVGADTVEVLMSYGYTEDELLQLRNNGIIN